VGLCVTVSVFLSLSALRVNDYFLKPEYNSFRSTDRSVYRPLHWHISMRGAQAPHLEIRKAILQCLSVLSLCLSPTSPPSPPPSLPPSLPPSESRSLPPSRSHPLVPSLPLSPI
jgi:hypothetical protein